METFTQPFVFLMIKANRMSVSFQCSINVSDVSTTNHDVKPNLGLHGALAEPQGCCALAPLAALVHHPLSPDKETASFGIKVPPLDQTGYTEH